MKFTCHAVTDHGQIMKWVIVGFDRTFRGPFLDALKDRVLFEFPGAEFEEGPDIPWGMEPR